jgi:cytochrome P450
MTRGEFNPGVYIRIIYTYIFLPSFRRLHRATQAALAKTAVRDYHPTLTKESTILVSALLANPSRADRYGHFQRIGASVVMSIVYGYPTLPSVHDKGVEDIETFNDHVGVSVDPGRFLVEVFPWMMYIPARSQV